MCTPFLSVAESAPWACFYSVRNRLVKLEVLDGVAQTQLVDASATSYIAINFHNWQIIDKLFCISLMRYSRYLACKNKVEIYFQKELTWVGLGSQSSSSNVYFVMAKLRIGVAILNTVGMLSP